MLFETIFQNNFNKPDSLFISSNYYPSFTKVGFIIKNGYASPNGANAIAPSKQLSVKKAFSEILERRNLLLGGSVSKEDKVPTWDIVGNKSSYLPYEYTTYQTEGPFPSDTTGTATHFNSIDAVEIAVKELLEKNALFLFWYGKVGKRLEINSDILNLTIHKHLEREIDDLKMFVNTSFGHLKVVFTILLKKGSIISCGIGTSFSIEEAIKKSLEESYILKWQKEFNNILSLEFMNVAPDTINHESQMEYLEHLSQLPIYTRQSDDEVNSGIYPCIPSWVTNMHVIMLQNKLYPSLKCVKVFSTDLYNHVPLHQYIKATQKINIQTINLSESEILSIPDCIFI
ncbi:YcaO-like family protein [Bacillus sp. NTK074B]|uniref:YcaO-like family protein n=1 Tax=Bacillus sp. NTK074B TaxID=2802174 RepID=UPI001A906980|nr:YcaO-like family protein [Bacillus sp. NTK074B]